MNPNRVYENLDTSADHSSLLTHAYNFQELECSQHIPT